MLKDIEKAEGTAAMKNFIYEVSYHMHSAHAQDNVDAADRVLAMYSQISSRSANASGWKA